MYRLYADYYKQGVLNPDRKLIWSPDLNSPDYAIYDAKCERELNESGSLEFTVPPTNVNFGAIDRMKTSLVVVDVDSGGNETVVWRGRCLEDKLEMDGCRTYTCEGELAFFNDSCVEDSDFYEIWDEDDEVGIPVWMYFVALIAEHNMWQCKTYGNTSGIFQNICHVDMVVDISDTCADMYTYVQYANVWLQQKTSASASDIWPNRPKFIIADKNTSAFSSYSLLDITNSSYAHVYTIQGIEGSNVHGVNIAIVPLPDDYLDNYKVLSGCNVVPKGAPSVTLDITGYPSVKSQLDSLIDEYGGYIKATDQYVAYEHPSDVQEMIDDGLLPSTVYFAPFSNTASSASTYRPFIPVITYMDVPGHESGLTLEVGDNITDISVSTDCSDMVTVLVPTGNESDSWDGLIQGAYGKNISGPYIYSEAAVKTFGAIGATESFDVDDQESLIAEACSHLEEHMSPTWSMDLSVIDKGLIYPEYETLEYGNVYRIKADSIDVDTHFVMTKESLNLQDPSSNSYEFYTERGAWTDAEFQNADGEAMRFATLLDSCRTEAITYLSSSVFSTYPIYQAISTALADSSTIEIIEDGYGDSRPNLNATSYITPTKILYCYPSVAGHTIYPPYGKASFLCVVIKNTSTNIVFQIAMPCIGPGHCLYRRFKNGVEKRKSTKTARWQELTPDNAQSVWRST